MLEGEKEHLEIMSILLSLLRSPLTPGSFRNRRSTATNEICTEMGVFNRSNTEGTELLGLPAVVFPTSSIRECSEHNISEHIISKPLKKELGGDEHAQSLGFSFRAPTAAEVAFAYQCLSPGAFIGADVYVQEAFERLCWSGSVLCNLLCSALPGSLDERAINTPYDGSGNLTPDDVVENFQLCLSCAHAQGCDIQGLTVERLRACEVSCLTGFVLEVLRLSAVQALPAPDQRILIGPSSQVTGPARVAPRNTHPQKGRPTTWPLPTSSGHQVPGEKRGGCNVQGRGPGPSSTSSSSSDAANDGADVLEHPEISPAPALQPGTATARRAMVGLERWARQVIGTQHVTEPAASPNLAATSSAPATPGTQSSASSVPSAAHGPCLQLSPMLSSSAAAEGATIPGAVSTRSSTASCQRSRSDNWDTGTGLDTFSSASGWPSEDTDRSFGDFGVVTGGGGGPIAPAVDADKDLEAQSEADPLGLEAWERLSELLFQPLGCIEVPIGDTASGAALAEEAPEVSTPGSSCVAAGEALGALTPRPPLPPSQPTTQLRPAVPGDDEGTRWAAAAAVLSSALAAASPWGHGPPLPALRAEHLQCRHPGLRALILARALLAYCRRRDSAPAGEGADGDSRSRSSNSSSDQASKGVISPDAEAAEQETGVAAVAAAVAAAAAAAAKMLPASPAPPLPQRQESSSSSLASTGGFMRRQRSTGVPPPLDLLSEHNLLVLQEHHLREVRRQQKQQQQQQQQQYSVSGDGCGNAGGDRPCGSVAVATAADAKGLIWSGDEDDEEATDQEERVLRLWLNSLDGGIHVSSLFEQEVTTGWPLLLALEAIQPGCVPWSEAFRPPFKEKLRKILSVQNCNLVIGVCTRQLAMPPLVNIGGLDLALGQRRATLSLVFQMMRHHMGMLLGLAAPHPSPSPMRSPAMAPAIAATAQQPPPSYGLGHGCIHSYSHDTPPQMAQQVPYAPSPQRGTRAHVEVEKAVLAWANAKLQEAAIAAAAAAAAAAPDGTEAVATSSAPCLGSGVAPQLPFTPLASFSDKRLGKGRVLLQLLAAICPRSVNPKYVLHGRDKEERGSNARYLLSCARKLGCVIFLAWEDVVAARPNLLLLLLASFMALDRKRASAAAMTAAEAVTPVAGTTGASAAVKNGMEVAPGRTTPLTQAPVSPLS